MPLLHHISKQVQERIVCIAAVLVVNIFSSEPQVILSQKVISHKAFIRGILPVHGVAKPVHQNALDTKGLQVRADYPSAEPEGLAYCVKVKVNVVVLFRKVLHAIELGDVLAVVCSLEPVDEGFRAPGDNRRKDYFQRLLWIDPSNGDTGRPAGVDGHVVVNAHGS